MLREGEIRQQHTLEALEPQKRDGGPMGCPARFHSVLLTMQNSRFPRDAERGGLGLKVGQGGTGQEPASGVPHSDGGKTPSKRTFEGKGGDERSAAGNRMRRDCSGQSNPGNERSGASRRTETIGESAHPGKEMGPIFHGIHSCAHVGGRRVRLTSWRLACLMQVAK
jgi:hypothetical protein